MDWIEKFCVAVPISEKLEILSKLQEGQKYDPYREYMLDTTFLANRSDFRLISDDTISYKLLHPTGGVVSSELFLRNYSKNYEGEVLPLLLESNYRGILIEEITVFEEFEKHIHGKLNLFDKCLQNLSINLTYNPRNMQVGIKLIKSIYTKSFITESRKRLLTQRVFYNILRGTLLKQEQYISYRKLVAGNFLDQLPKIRENIVGDYDIVWASIKQF